MKYVVIILGVLFISLISLVLFFYFQFEKPAKIELESRMITFNIAAFDYYNQSQIETSYQIIIDSELKDEQKTSDKGRILFTSLVNKSIKICNKNLENQNYYINCYEKELTDLTPDNNRVDLNLLSPGDLIISKDSYFGDKDMIILSVNTTKMYKSPIFCLKWTSHLYSVNTIFKMIQKEENYASYDKCYLLDKDITNDTSFIPIKYKITGVIDDKDFIRVIFIDRDNLNGNLVTNINGLNVGSQDVIYEIK